MRKCKRDSIANDDFFLKQLKIGKEKKGRDSETQIINMQPDELISERSLRSMKQISSEEETKRSYSRETEKILV